MDQQTYYQVDENGIYLSPILAFGLPYRCVTVKPPETSLGQVAKWVTDLNPTEDEDFGTQGSGQWQLLADHRDKPLYNKSDGSLYEGDYQGLGDIPGHVTDQAPPSLFHSWIDNAWGLTQEGENALQAEMLAQRKNQKLNEINMKAENFIDDIVHFGEVPDFEVQTWIKQAQEAYDWEMDPNSPTPTLDYIAQGRGIERTVLIQKALQKAKQFDRLISYTAGLRQHYEDMLKRANSIEAVEVINPIYYLPTGGENET